MTSVRNQIPDENSRIQQLKIFMRDLALSNKPFVTYSPAEDGSHFQINVGRSKIGGKKSPGSGSERRTVKMTVWQDGSRFLANTDLPQWAKDVAPAKDSNRIYVFKHSGGDKMGSEHAKGESGSFTGVRLRVQDKDEFINLVTKMVTGIIDTLRGRKTEGGETSPEEEMAVAMKQEAAFPIVGVPINEEIYYEDACTYPFNFDGDGEGQYLAVRTSGSSEKAVVEIFGPIPTHDRRGDELKIESLHLDEGWQPLVKVEAKTRNEAISQAARYFTDKGFETEQTYGTLHIHSPGMLSESRLGKTEALVAEATRKGFKRGQKPFLKVSSDYGYYLVVNLHDEHGRAIPLGGAFKKNGGYADDNTPVFHKTIKDFKTYYLKQAKDGKYGDVVKASADMIKEAVSEEPEAKTTRPLYIIAREIKKLWPKPNYAAQPYLDAMMELDSVKDKFYEDYGDDIVRRFIGNARSWSGPDAKRIKDELKKMIGK